MYTNLSDRRDDASSIFAPEVHARLQALRQRMDPMAVFHASQEIPVRTITS